MKLYIEVPSKIPSFSYWLMVIFVIYHFYSGFTKDNIKQIPNLATTMIVILLAMLALEYLLEKFLPKRKVIFSEVENGQLIISKNSGKLLQKKILVSNIQEIKLAKNYSLDLYIFLKDGKVKIISDSKDNLNSLKLFIERAMET